MTTEPEGPRPPQQKRSEATLARILEAARTLLAGRDLDDITVEEVARLETEETSPNSGGFFDKLKKMFEA